MQIMTSGDYYNTIEKKAIAEYKDRGSRFIAYAFPAGSLDDFKSNLKAVKKEHPKATHYCFAYRIGSDGKQFRVADDGEPSGTAGRPILGQIDARDLTNTLVIVVRYFGGTLLGAPGLARAYKSSAALALQLTPVLQKAVERNFVLEFDYTVMNEVMKIIKQSGCRIISHDLQLFCRMRAGIPKPKLEEVLPKLRSLKGISIKEDA